MIPPLARMQRKSSARRRSYQSMSDRRKASTYSALSRMSLVAEWGEAACAGSWHVSVSRVADGRDADNIKRRKHAPLAVFGHDHLSPAGRLQRQATSTFPACCDNYAATSSAPCIVSLPSAQASSSGVLRIPGMPATFAEIEDVDRSVGIAVVLDDGRVADHADGWRTAAAAWHVRRDARRRSRARVSGSRPCRAHGPWCSRKHSWRPARSPGCPCPRRRRLRSSDSRHRARRPRLRPWRRRASCQARR